MVADDNRIKQSLETINYLIEKKCKIILLSHLGKVKTKEDSETLTLLPVKDELSKLLNEEVKFSSELKGKELEKKINSLKEKEYIFDKIFLNECPFFAPTQMLRMSTLLKIGGFDEDR